MISTINRFYRVVNERRQNILEVCKRSRDVDEYKHYFAYGLTVALTGILTLFAINSFINGMDTLLAIQLVLILSNIASIYIRTVHNNSRFLVWNLNVTYTLYLSYMVLMGDPYQNSATLFWMVAFPILATSVNGILRGTSMIVIYLAIAIIPVISITFPILPVSYDINVIQNFFMVMVFMGYLAFSLEYYRAKTLRDVEDSKNRFKKISNTDALTHLHNRRFAQKKILQCCHNRESFCILFIDLDNFKHVNDIYGHDTGDDILKLTADSLTRNIRGGDDIVARWGGEEFIVLLQGNTLEDSTLVAERMRQSIEELEYTISGGIDLKITASFGVACSSERKTAKEIIALADKRLYSSKSNGRNRVTFRGDFH